MKRSLGEMSPEWFGSSRHQSSNGSEMTVLERQQTQMKLQLQQRMSSTSETQYNDQAKKMQDTSQTQSLPSEDTGLHNTIMMLDHCLGWPELEQISMPKEMLHSSFSCSYKHGLETSTLTIANSTGVPSKKFILEKDGDNYVPTAAPKTELEIIEESLKMRKMDQFPQPKVHQIHLSSNNSREMSNDLSKGNSRLPEVAKSDYIQVRARRGQATDKHSLAERVRREKISQKMKFLQDLVPGCNKITGKTGMLDEIINYVQALQSQVEFLSMKIATATTLNFNNAHNLLPEVLAENAPKYLQMTIPDAYSANLPLSQIQASTVTETMPAWAHDNSQDTASFATWDTHFQAIPGSEFHQRKYTTLPSQPTEGDSTITRMPEKFTLF